MLSTIERGCRSIATKVTSYLFLPARICWAPLFRRLFHRGKIIGDASLVFMNRVKSIVNLTVMSLCNIYIATHFLQVRPTFK